MWQQRVASESPGACGRHISSSHSASRASIALRAASPTLHTISVLKNSAHAGSATCGWM